MISKSFYRRPPLDVARDLLNCQLCRSSDQGVERWQITETEAYIGPEDKACHAHAGRTKRTDVMFEPGGVWYVYLCYGIHWLLNIVTDDRDFPSAVLLRGAGDLHGPGRLTKALEIGGDLNRQSAVRSSGLWIEEGQTIPANSVVATPRIGVDYAGPDWSQRPYRFIPDHRVKRAKR